jgi:hypothetical protein
VHLEVGIFAQRFDRNKHSARRLSCAQFRTAIRASVPYARNFHGNIFARPATAK